jgi:hypothetical protein
MNRSELATALAVEGINSEVYSLDGGHPNDTFCLDYVGHKGWTVYYSERGSESDQKFFDTEDEACRYLLATLTDTPSDDKQ